MDQEPRFDLDYLLKNMQPVLDGHQLVFCSLAPEKAEEYLTICQGFYCEREGVTVIIDKHLADLDQLPYEFVFKRITLNVYSSLGSVGFLARITEILAAQGFSVNVISAYHHDHLYIQAHQAQSALETLLSWQDKLSE
ncbi:MAG: ACT domain-containing protein [Anaerolineales bacterium]